MMSDSDQPSNTQATPAVATAPPLMPPAEPTVGEDAGAVAAITSTDEGSDNRSLPTPNVVPVEGATLSEAGGQQANSLAAEMAADTPEQHGSGGTSAMDDGVENIHIHARHKGKTQ